MKTHQIKTFRKTIYDFYKKNERDLPWRPSSLKLRKGEKELDPYKILVSEIMLQQTQADRVIKKYHEFIKVFPTSHILSQASLKKIVKVWQGLGYNRRAIHLHQAAKIIERDYKGKLPQRVDELVRLPGVGAATASSIAAFAFNIPTVFIETNIRSVYIHYFFRDRDNVYDKEIIPLIERTLDRKNPREWYFALMDYGAMLKRKYKNPSRRSIHHIKQTPFVGSDRQVRGEILRFLLSSESVNKDDLIKTLQQDKSRVLRLLQAMEKDGFMKQEGQYIRLLDQRD